MTILMHHPWPDGSSRQQACVHTCTRTHTLRTVSKVLTLPVPCLTLKSWPVPLCSPENLALLFVLAFSGNFSDYRTSLFP